MPTSPSFIISDVTHSVCRCQPFRWNSTGTVNFVQHPRGPQHVGRVGEDVMRMLRGCYEETGVVECRNTTRRHVQAATQGDLDFPRTRTVTFGSRAFSVSGPMCWNSLSSLGPFYGAIAVPSVTRCRCCRCCGYRCTGGVRQ